MVEETVSVRGGELYAVRGHPYLVARMLSYDEDAPRLAECVKDLDAPVAYIQSVFVSPTIRGRGVGHELVRKALEKFHDAGVRYVFLHAMPDPGWEEELLRFYGDFGFIRAEKCQDETTLAFTMMADLW